MPDLALGTGDPSANKRDHRSKVTDYMEVYGFNRTRKKGGRPSHSYTDEAALVTLIGWLQVLLITPDVYPQSF